MIKINSNILLFKNNPITKDIEILIGKYNNYWSLPIGEVEQLEDPIFTAERVVLENTGLIVNSPVEKFHFFPYYNNIDKKNHSLDLFFIGDIIGGKLNQKYKWYSICNLPEPIYPSLNQLISIKKLFT